MAIPKEILAVKRPKNTFVVAYGKNKDRYGVRQFIGCRYDKGRHNPIKGPTIGHIVGGKYVPIPDATENSESGIDLVDWANVQLCDNVFKDVLDELRQVFTESEALKIYGISILRVTNPGIKDYELKEAYDSSFLATIYPAMALTKNTVCELHSTIGKSYSRILSFMRMRANKIGADDSVLIDGTLKSNESKVNSLSDFSRKAKLKGSRDISIIYAFDLALYEPICSKCYPGNMLDGTAQDDFLTESGITNGVLVGDKGFHAVSMEDADTKNPNMHHLIPIRRNSRYYEEYRLTEYDGVLECRESIMFKKVHIKKTNKWLYAFRDANRAALEEKAYMARTKKDGTFNHADFEKARKTFGTIAFECDFNTTPLDVYRMYEERWEIELVMRYYKTACEFDETRVHDDYSVIGSEFCDFLSTVLTFRLIKKFDAAELLKKYTYKRIHTFLRRAKKVRNDGQNWRLAKVNPSVEKVLRDLGLLPQNATAVKRKPGRPKKQRN